MRTRKIGEWLAGRAGFTLIESMIAMFFLAFIAGEMGMVYVYAAHNTGLSQRISRANALADEAVEKSRNTAYNKLQLPASFVDPIDCPPSDGSVAPDPTHVADEVCATSGTVVTCTSQPTRLNCSNRGVAYTRERTVSPLPPGTGLSASNQADVDVVVSFTDTRGIVQRVRVASVVTRY